MSDSPLPSLVRRRSRKFHEWLAEALIASVAHGTILLVVLILLFVGHEALPVLLQRESSASALQVRPADSLDSMNREEIMSYLDLSPEEFASMDRETLKLLMEIREEEARTAPSGGDANLNTLQWKYLLQPHQWTGYDKPAYIWQPVSEIRKFNLVPLLVGSLKATLIAILFAGPVSIGAALFVSQMAPAGWRRWLKPSLELLAGIPSVVLGFFALVVLATVLESHVARVLVISILFGVPLALGAPILYSSGRDLLVSVREYGPVAIDHRVLTWTLGLTCWLGCLWMLVEGGWPSRDAPRLNTVVAGLALGLAVVPVIFAVAEEALSSVPKDYREAALALGASSWQSAWQVVVPAALPGLFAALVLGFGRAIGETMIVLMASGNASVMSLDLFDSARTITATIAAELAETVMGGAHYRVLFLLGTLLFSITFVFNLAGDWIIHRLKAQLERHPS